MAMKDLSFSRRLSEAFELRKARNRRYSVRAFATALKADHGTVGQILRGTRAPTKAQIRDWSRRLGFSEVETMVYLATRLHEPPVQAAHKAAVAQAAAETLSLIGEPMHLAILSHVRAHRALPRLAGFAAARGRSIDDAQLALTRLLRLGWVAQEASGALHDATGLATLDAAAFNRFVLDRSAAMFQPNHKHAEGAS
jgi:hypothetical protein